MLLSKDYSQRILCQSKTAHHSQQRMWLAVHSEQPGSNAIRLNLSIWSAIIFNTYLQTDSPSMFYVAYKPTRRNIHDYLKLCYVLHVTQTVLKEVTMRLHLVKTTAGTSWTHC